MTRSTTFLVIVIVILATISIAEYTIFYSNSKTIQTSTTYYTTTATTSASTSTSTTVQSNSSVIVYNVTITDNSITPNMFSARKGQTVWFNVTNIGTRQHDFGIWDLGASYGTPILNPNGGFGVFQFSSTGAQTFHIFSNLDDDWQEGLNANLTVQ